MACRRVFPRSLLFFLCDLRLLLDVMLYGWCMQRGYTILEGGHVGGLIRVGRSHQSWTFTYMLPHVCPLLLV